MISHSSYLLFQNQLLSYFMVPNKFQSSVFPRLPPASLPAFFFPWYTRILDALVSKSTGPTISILTVIVIVKYSIVYCIVKHNICIFPRDWGYFFSFIFCVLLVDFELGKNVTFFLENNVFVTDYFDGVYCLANYIEKMNSTQQMLAVPRNVSEQAKELWRLFHK